MPFFGRSKKPKEAQDHRPALFCGVVGPRGSRSARACRQEDERFRRSNAPSPEPNPNLILQRRGGVRNLVSPSQQLPRGEKILRNYLNEQEKEARAARWRRRLFRRAVRWCQGGAPSPRDFIGKSSKEIADYLRSERISEEWIEAVIPQIENIRLEASSLSTEDIVDSELSLWPWGEKFTIIKTLRWKKLELEFCVRHR